eukprot:scaffold5596_cov78-Cylindrotheca_fusiformis.AAC.1
MVHREGSTRNNSPDPGENQSVDMRQFTELWRNHKFDGRLLEQEGPSRRVRSQQSTRSEENQRANDPSPTVHAQQFTRFGQNQKSKKIHLQGSRCDNSPDSGKNTRAYANFLASWATFRANDLSLSSDKRQFTKLGQNQK